MMLVQLRNFAVVAMMALLGVAYADTATPPNPLSTSNQSVQNQNSPATPINGVVAIVNNEVITSQELNDATDQAIAQAKAQNFALPDRVTIERQVLQGLIMQRIALQLAKLNNITIPPDELNAALATIAQQHQVTVDQMFKQLSASGVNIDEFKTNVQNQLIIQKLEQAAVGSSIIITPNEVSSYLANKARAENANTEYHVQHILIALPANPTADDYAQAKDRAQMVLTKIQQGMPFTQAAMTYSDSSDALNGGDLGYKTLMELPASFTNSVTSLQVGQVSDLVPTDSGFNIIKLVDKKGAPAQEDHYVNQYHVQAILVKTSPLVSSTQAQALLARLRTALNNGASFAKLAEANSQDPMSNQNGGDMGWVSLVSLNPILAAQIQATPVNQVSQPFQTTDGWYLIKVLGVQQVNDSANYEQEQAKQAIFMQKANSALQAWQSQIRGASYIQILDPNLQVPNS